MKICVYGAGAIGGVIAARIALSGAADVSIIARGPHLAAIQDGGIRLESGGTTAVARVPASDDPGVLGTQDVVIAAVKAHQLASIAEGLTRLMQDGTTVVYAVNGMPWWYFHEAEGPYAEKRLPLLDPGGHLWDRVGVDRTIGCVVNFPASVTSPGNVRHGGGNNRIALGELDSQQSPRLAEIAAALREAGFAVDTHLPIREEVWKKLAHVVTVSTIAVLTGAPSAAAFVDPLIRSLAEKTYAEIFGLAAALGTRFDADIKTLVAGHRSPNKPSMLQDMEAGRPMEIDPQLTAPVELAHEARLPVPTLDALLGLVRVKAAIAGLFPAQPG